MPRRIDSRLIRRACAGLLVCLAARGEAQELPRAPHADFVPPPAGSYELPVIDKAPNGRVLDSDGRRWLFSRFTRGRVTLVSFIYTYCVDPVGCPLAYETMARLRELLLARPELARATRFVSLSFDPVNDTPDAMRAYGGKFADPASPLQWFFLTTRSVEDLAPLTAGFGQDVAVQVDDTGRPMRLYNHMLKVFLTDARGRIREIYSPVFLVPEMMLNDIETLVLEQHAD
ncbi:MAG TPA: SCO family protein [Burkholderiaceae bacterium]|nr:SCO family protein [Burkholderiaceae bacterium]